MKTKFNLQLRHGVLTRYVDSQKHYFIKHKAYAYDEAELEKYKGRFHTLRITTSKGNTYEISQESFFCRSFLNSDYGKVQRFINASDLLLVAQKKKVVHLPMSVYLELKEESGRTGRPMTKLLEVKKMRA
jgi:hypothetical protein